MQIMVKEGEHSLHIYIYLCSIILAEHSSQQWNSYVSWIKNKQKLGQFYNSD